MEILNKQEIDDLIAGGAIEVKKGGFITVEIIAP